MGREGANGEVPEDGRLTLKLKEAAARSGVVGNVGTVHERGGRSSGRTGRFARLAAPRLPCVCEKEEGRTEELSEVSVRPGTAANRVGRG